MANLVNPGDSIECSASLVAVRKVSSPIFLKVDCIQTDDNGDPIQKALFKYKSRIRAIVKIVEELNPRNRIMCETSALDIDDLLEAETIEIYTERKYNFQLSSNFSHVHGIQGDTVKTFTYAKIIIPWQFVLDRQAKLNA